MKVLIFGANGFIGNDLVKTILTQTDWEIDAIDIADHHLKTFSQESRLHFMLGDMTQSNDWVEAHIKAADVVLPLAAIATPATYVKDPLRIFTLDFEANLAIVRQCVTHKKRVIFPSTSEVYGMCEDKYFDEEESNLILGPIHKERWIYSCTKQLLDRIIYAYGSRHGLPYTLFRPFNWIGPKQDNIHNPKPGSSRMVTQFLGHILRGEDIHLVGGGLQQRSFIYIDDGIDALVKIIANKNGCAHNRIFNIGNPQNIASVKEVAEILLSLAKQHPKFKQKDATRLLVADPNDYYGEGYQDVRARVPSIERAKTMLRWMPKTDLLSALTKIVDYHLNAA